MDAQESCVCVGIPDLALSSLLLSKQRQFELHMVNMVGNWEHETYLTSDSVRAVWNLRYPSGRFVLSIHTHREGNKKDRWN